jgi:hypothetical protein
VFGNRALRRIFEPKREVGENFVMSFVIWTFPQMLLGLPKSDTVKMGERHVARIGVILNLFRKREEE